MYTKDLLKGPHTRHYAKDGGERAYKGFGRTVHPGSSRGSSALVQRGDYGGARGALQVRSHDTPPINKRGGLTLRDTTLTFSFQG
jgi:hypothetical protein